MGCGASHSVPLNQGNGPPEKTDSNTYNVRTATISTTLVADDGTKQTFKVAHGAPENSKHVTTGRQSRAHTGEAENTPDSIPNDVDGVKLSVVRRRASAKVLGKLPSLSIPNGQNATLTTTDVSQDNSTELNGSSAAIAEVVQHRQSFGSGTTASASAYPHAKTASKAELREQIIEGITQDILLEENTAGGTSTADRLNKDTLSFDAATGVREHIC